MARPDDLKNQIFFEDNDKKGIEKISNLLKEASHKIGTHIFKECEDTKGIYLIRSGKVEISKVTSDGWKQTLAVLQQGHFFGELSIIEKRKHEATAVALEPASLLLLKKEDFEKIENEDYALAAGILKKLIFVLSGNLRRMNQKFLDALISY